MKLLVIDDHPIVLDGLAALLAGSSPGAIVLTAPDAQSGFRMLDDHADLDVVLLDLRLPGLNGHAAISEFGRLRPTLPVIVLSSSEDPVDVRKAISLGALGYVPKSASRHVLMSAIDLVLKGEIYIPPLLVDNAVYEKQGDRQEELPAPTLRLTERQVEVLALLNQGQPTKTIATHLNLSEKTVKIHISAIFKALNVVNRTQAAAVGRNLGLI
jgi:two-component system, NarL family, nitrate/nitrite response regulator NarL